MAVIEMLKKLSSRKNGGPEALRGGLAEISLEIREAVAEMERIEAEFGERLLEALANGNPEEVEARRDQSRRRIERLKRAEAELQARLKAAQDAEDRDQLAQRWDEAEKALRARRLALVRLERLSKEFGKACLDAEAAALAAWEAMPMRHASPNAAATQSIQPHLIDLRGEVSRLLSLATEGRFGGFAGSALWTIQQQPSLVDRAEMLANEWRALRPRASRSDGPPEAA